MKIFTNIFFDTDMIESIQVLKHNNQYPIFIVDRHTTLLIWVETDWHSDDITMSLFVCFKKLIWRKVADYKKSCIITKIAKR